MMGEDRYKRISKEGDDIGLIVAPGTDITRLRAFTAEQDKSTQEDEKNLEKIALKKEVQLNIENIEYLIPVENESNLLICVSKENSKTELLATFEAEIDYQILNLTLGEGDSARKIGERKYGIIKRLNIVDDVRAEDISDYEGQSGVVLYRGDLSYAGLRNLLQRVVEHKHDIPLLVSEQIKIDKRRAS